MTPNEIQTLITGMAIGAQLMNLLHMRWDRQPTRGRRTEAQAARKRSAGDAYLASLRLYQLRQRTEAGR